MGVFDSAGQINQDILAATMIAVGLFVAFFGARFFKQIIFFIGFCAGLLFTYYAVPIFFKWFGVTLEDDVILYMSLTVGALVGILVVVIYKVAVFTCGAIAGAIFSQILWSAVIANIKTPEKDYMTAIQIGVLIVFACAGGWLAFKFVEQVLKAITAFMGGFMFASGIAYFIGRIDSSESKNVIDWVVFFGSYKVYNNLDAVCDEWCIICILLWLALFAAGCFVQYKLHKKHKRKDHDDGDSDSEDSSDSDDSDDDSDSENSNKRKKKRKKKRRHSNSSDDEENVPQEANYYEPAKSQHGGYAPSYAGSQYGASSARYPNASVASQSAQEGPNIAPSVVMSSYGANYYNGQPQTGPGLGPGVNTAHSSQYGSYGQRDQVQYV
eukprot:153101_1